MNKPTVTSAVSHGHLSREPRFAQPLPTVTSAVDPTGHLSREPRFN